jgi:hypothetical protein
LPWKLDARTCQAGGLNDAILRLKIVLADTEPPIWRRVEVPAEMTLRQLHTVIQVAIGWDDDHLHQFYRGRNTLPARLRHQALKWLSFLSNRPIYPQYDPKSHAGLG